MIDIDIEDKTKEQVRFGGTLYTIDFSDENREKIIASFTKREREMDKLSKEYKQLDDDEETPKELLADKAIDALKWERDSAISFLDLLFGTGEGIKIYRKCGSSTDYMNQKIEELGTALTLKRNNDRKAEFQAIRNKYVKHRNKRR